jgi:transcriptional regulator with XRE-family HTH domain
MDSPSDWDFSIVTRSGLTRKEFAALAKVSSVTAIHWIQGRRVPSRHTAVRAAKLLERLTEAVQRGQLPPTTPKPSARVTPERARQRNREIINALQR